MEDTTHNTDKQNPVKQQMLPVFLFAGFVVIAISVFVFLKKSKPDNDLFPVELTTQCIQGTKASKCYIGSTLLFKIKNPPEYKFFSAYMIDGSSGRWLIPKTKQETSTLIARRIMGYLQHGYSLAVPLKPGTYDFFGFFSTEPTTQTSLQSLLLNLKDLDIRHDNGILIKRSQFTIYPNPVEQP